MRLGDFAPIFETMFTDKMSIFRYENKDNEDGSTDTVLPHSPLYTNVPCRVSFSRKEESPKDNEVDDTPVIIAPKIFCKVDTDIKAGDVVTITRFNDDGDIIATYSGKVGLPSVLITHKEVAFLIKESA